jgi:predicted small secreted protein
LWTNKHKLENMKKLFIIVLCCLSLSSCGTTGMQGNPAAIQIGASVGGALGSIIGGSSDDYGGWVIGNMVGTIAGAAIGNAVSTPQNRQQSVSGRSMSDDEEDYPVRSSAPSRSEVNRNYQQSENLQSNNELPLIIEDIRFVDENRNHIIEPKESCKLVFDMINTSNSTLFNVFPKITVSDNRIGVSNPMIIDKIDANQRIRYTATLYGYSNLRTGRVNITITASQKDGPDGDSHQFSLQTQR